MTMQRARQTIDCFSFLFLYFNFLFFFASIFLKFVSVKDHQQRVVLAPPQLYTHPQPTLSHPFSLIPTQSKRMWKKIPPSFEIMQTTTTQGRQDTHKKQQQQETPEQRTDDGLVNDLSPRQPSAFYIHVRVFRYSMKINEYNRLIKFSCKWHMARVQQVLLNLQF